MQQPKPILFTQKGYEDLLAEKQKLESERPIAVAELKKAREMGDLSENGFYKSARAKLSGIDSRLRYMTHLIRYAKIQEGGLRNTVDVGVTVHLASDNGDVIYMIVGEHEANPSEKKISHKSPLGHALLGKKVGESAVLQMLKGQTTYKILKIN